MKEQNYSNHIRISSRYHIGVLGLILVYIVAAARVIYKHYTLHWGLMIPILLTAGGILLLIVAFFARSFALKAQDRAIRAEENLRYFAITGSLLDSRLTLQQIIALRFASNNELLDLAHKAAHESLTPKQIKKEIKHWRGDYYRV